MQFKDIVGQRDVINRLTEIIDSGRISHAQHIIGEERDGSLQLAMAYLQYLCCEHRQHFLPASGENAGNPENLPVPNFHDSGEQPLRADSCGECPSCKKLASLQHPDLHFVFPNPPNGSSSVSSEDYMPEFLDFVRRTHAKGTLDEFNQSLAGDVKTSIIRATDAARIVKVLDMMPYEGGWRMMVIWNAYKMNAVAANELLKTLEEPRPRTIILLVDSYDKKLLPTIVSRVQPIVLHGGDHSEEEQELAREFAPLLVEWLRMLFKLKMKELSAQVDKMASMGREQQKQFLAYALGVMRDCFLKSAAGVPCNLGSGDAKFDASFPNMITTNNIELIDTAFNDAIFAIERNAYSKIALMELSFRISKALKKR